LTRIARDSFTEVVRERKSGQLNNNSLKFWEENAPTFEERLDSLKYAYFMKYRTSVSIEPFLDKNPSPLIIKLSTYVSDTIWIGKMNYVYAKKARINVISFYKHIQEINNKEMFSDDRMDALLKESLQYFQISVVIILLMVLVTLIHMGWSHVLHIQDLIF